MITGGLVTPALLVPRALLSAFSADPVNTPIVEISSRLGLAIIQVAEAAGATFSTTFEAEQPPQVAKNQFFLRLIFPTGWSALYVDPPSLLAHKQWFFHRGVSLMVSRGGLEFSGANLELYTSAICQGGRIVRARRSGIKPCRYADDESPRLFAKRLIDGLQLAKS